MEGRPAFWRGVVVGVLLMMVVRSVVWLATPSEHPDAATGAYVLNVANIVICGATAWSTAFVNERLAAKLDKLRVTMNRAASIGRR